MLKWLRRLFHRPPPACLWSVAVDEGRITIDDGQGSRVDVAVTDLAKVVVATDDSGPWGDDVVFLLYSNAPDPIGIFPLEAEGCDDFVGWLSGLQGYDEQEFGKAIRSTRVAHFKVFGAHKPD